MYFSWQWIFKFETVKSTYEVKKKNENGLYFLIGANLQHLIFLTWVWLLSQLKCRGRPCLFALVFGHCLELATHLLSTIFCVSLIKFDWIVQFKTSKVSCFDQGLCQSKLNRKLDVLYRNKTHAMSVSVFQYFVVSVLMLV